MLPLSLRLKPCFRRFCEHTVCARPARSWDGLSRARRVEVWRPRPTVALRGHDAVCLRQLTHRVP